MATGDESIDEGDGDLAVLAVELLEIADAFEQWDGEETKIPRHEQEKMFQNLREAMEFQGLKLVVEGRVEPDARGIVPLRPVDDSHARKR